MNECDLRLTEFQLGFITAVMQQYRNSIYDDQAMIDLCKDVIARCAKARSVLEEHK